MPHETDALNIEGLAAQLYAEDASKRGAMYVWWHLLRVEIKEQFRNDAMARIKDYNRRVTLRGRHEGDKPEG